MDEGWVCVDRPDGSLLSVATGGGVDDSTLDTDALAALRRELRLWSRQFPAEVAATRSIDLETAMHAAEALGSIALSGVIGNAAYDAFPKAAALVARLRGKRPVVDASVLAGRIERSLRAGPSAFVSFELLRAVRHSDGTWQAVVRLDNDLYAVAADQTGNMLIWQKVSAP